MLAWGMNYFPPSTMTCVGIVRLSLNVIVALYLGMARSAEGHEVVVGRQAAVAHCPSICPRVGVPGLSNCSLSNCPDPSKDTRSTLTCLLTLPPPFRGGVSKQ